MLNLFEVFKFLIKYNHQFQRKPNLNGNLKNFQDINEIFGIWRSIPITDRFQKARFKKKLAEICKADFPCLLTDTDTIIKEFLHLLSQREEIK